MRITLDIDDKLYAKAVALTDIQETSTLVTKSLKALVERESAQKLSILGGSQHDLEPISRRQSQPDG